MWASIEPEDSVRRIRQPSRYKDSDEERRAAFACILQASKERRKGIASLNRGVFFEKC